jgi:hypothetical protein
MARTDHPVEENVTPDADTPVVEILEFEDAWDEIGDKGQRAVKPGLYLDEVKRADENQDKVYLLPFNGDDDYKKKVYELGRSARQADVKLQTRRIQYKGAFYIKYRSVTPAPTAE